MKFLGTLIKRIAPVNGPLRKPKAAGQIWMGAPLKILAKRLKEKGFWKSGPKGPIPIGVGKFTAFPLKDLILRFRSILLGLLNYYSFVDNIYTLRYIYFLLLSSLQRTIQRKENIGYRECLAKYGPTVYILIYKRDGSTVELSFECPPLRKNLMNFKGTERSKDPLLIKDWKVSTITALGQCCASCGSTSRIEMHHLKHLKTVNVKLDSAPFSYASIF